MDWIQVCVVVLGEGTLTFFSHNVFLLKMHTCPKPSPCSPQDKTYRYCTSTCKFCLMDQIARSQAFFKLGKKHAWGGINYSPQASWSQFRWNTSPRSHFSVSTKALKNHGRSYSWIFHVIQPSEASMLSLLIPEATRPQIMKVVTCRKCIV